MITDEQLVEKIKKDADSDAIETLLERHGPLVIHTIGKYSKPLESHGLSTEDLVDEKHFLIYSAANSFNPTKGVKVSTWIASSVRYYVLTLLRKVERKPTVPLNEDIFKIAQDSDEGIVLSAIQSLDNYGDRRVKKVFDIRYFSRDKKPCSWKSVAKTMGLTVKTVQLLHQRGLNTILNEINV